MRFVVKVYIAIFAGVNGPMASFRMLAARKLWQVLLVLVRKHATHIVFIRLRGHWRVKVGSFVPFDRRQIGN